MNNGFLKGITKPRLLVLASLFTLTAAAQGAEVDVYLITGQSNSNNFGDGATIGSTEVDFNLIFARVSKTMDPQPLYTAVVNPFSSSSLAPNVAITELARKLNRGRDMAVFIFGRNGTPLAVEEGRNENDTWYPGDDPASGQTLDDNMYGNLLSWTNARFNQIIANGDTPVVRGLFWFQGERDAVIGTPQTEYETNFTNLISRFRADFGADLPIVATRIREVGADIANRVAVNQALENIADATPSLTLVDPATLSWISTTNVHLNAAGYSQLASLWSSEMLALQNASISWSAAQDTTGKSDLIEGEIVLALNGGSDSVTISDAGPLNDSAYSFIAADFTPSGFFKPDNFSNVVTSHLADNVYESNAITTTGDGNFDALVDSLATPQGNPSGIDSGTITLDSLTPGETYLVQLFTNEQRAPLADPLLEFSDLESTPATVQALAGQSTPGIQSDDYGQFVVGTFTAQAETQALRLTLVNPDSNASTSSNLLVNGGFESPTHSNNDGTNPDNWTVLETNSGNNPDRQVRTRDVSPRNGTMGLNLGAGNSLRDGQLYQTITTEPGKLYECRGWYFSPQGNIHQSLSLSIFDGSDLSGTLVASTGTLAANNSTWKELILAFTAQSTSTTILITDEGTLANDNAGLSLDDFSVTEPSSPALPTDSNVHLNALLVTAPSNFQLWARGQNIPALETEDANQNGTPNLLEFATGPVDLLNLDANDQLSFTVKGGALADGYSIQVEFSSDLEGWTTATSITTPIQLLSSSPESSGDLLLNYQINWNSAPPLFWRLTAE